MDLFDSLEEGLVNRYNGWAGTSQFEGTGERLRRVVEEMCWTPQKIQEEAKKCLQSVFSEEYSEMLVSGPTSVWALCPHHLFPCHFEVFIGYIPKGSVLGLSKFSRIAIIMGKRPIMQEMYSRELADIFWNSLDLSGLGVYVVGRHGCVISRGVGQQEADVSTSILKGNFLDDPAVRQEFYDAVKTRIR